MSVPEPRVRPTENGAPPAAAPRRRRFELRRDAPRVALVLLGLLVLDLVLWLALVRPVRRDLAALEERQQNAAVVERQVRQQLEDLRGLRAHVRGVEQGIDRFFDEMLATRQERLVPFQEALADVGRDFNVVPRSVAINYEELQQEGIDAVGFSFPLSGGYENLRRFLARLEQVDQFLIVRQVALGGDREGGRALQLGVDIETYFNAPERAAAEAAAPPARRRGQRPGRR